MPMRIPAPIGRGTGINMALGNVFQGLIQADQINQKRQMEQLDFAMRLAELRDRQALNQEKLKQAQEARDERVTRKRSLEELARMQFGQPAERLRGAAEGISPQTQIPSALDEEEGLPAPGPMARETTGILEDQARQLLAKQQAAMAFPEKFGESLFQKPDTMSAAAEAQKIRIAQGSRQPTEQRPFAVSGSSIYVPGQGFVPNPYHTDKENKPSAFEEKVSAILKANPQMSYSEAVNQATGVSRWHRDSAGRLVPVGPPGTSTPGAPQVPAQPGMGGLPQPAQPQARPITAYDAITKFNFTSGPGAAASDIAGHSIGLVPGIGKFVTDPETEQAKAAINGLILPAEEFFRSSGRLLGMQYADIKGMVPNTGWLTNPSQNEGRLKQLDLTAKERRDRLVALARDPNTAPGLIPEIQRAIKAADTLIQAIGWPQEGQGQAGATQPAPQVGKIVRNRQSGQSFIYTRDRGWVPYGER